MGFSAVLIKGGDVQYHSSAKEASAVVNASPSRVFSLMMYNDNAATRWFQVFNASALPANGTVPAMTVEVPAGNTAYFDFQSGNPFTTGIVVANSTTDVTLTVGGADALFNVVYRGGL